MASQFYKRYIPPPIKVPEGSGEEHPPKKRKKSKTAPSTSEKLLQSERKHGHDIPRQAAEEGEGYDEKLPLRSKHSNVFARFEDATKHSEDNARVSSPQDEPMGEQEVQKVDSHGLEPLPQPTETLPAPKVSSFSALPTWLQSPVSVSATDTVPFADLPINETTVSVLHKQGYDNALAVQSALIPMLTSQRYVGDICVSAATGSGKTLAYVLPMVEQLRNNSVKAIRGLIVVPTRELVDQVKKTLELCIAGSGLTIGTAIGSKPLKEEQAMLVHKGQRYDPKACKAEQEREIDEDEELMDWDFDKRFGPKDDFELYHNHVVEYTSKVDILICTPGRLVEHVQSTTGFSLKYIEWLVVDEADRLLDESFQQWVDVILPGLEYQRPLDSNQQLIMSLCHPLRPRNVQKVILSATMTKDIGKLASLKLRWPRLVVLEGQPSHERGESEGQGLELPATLREVGLPISDLNDRPLYLIKLLLDMEGPGGNVNRNWPKSQGTSDSEISSDDSTTSTDAEASSRSSHRSATLEKGTSKQPTTQLLTHGTLIFTKTNENATRLARLIALMRPAWSPKVGTLTKSSASSSGKKTLNLFRKQKISILVASDRASRGLDIQDLAHVINYDMPSSLESYIHRVGRTARAGKQGQAITLIAENEARWFWNDIARNEKVGRGGKRVSRDNTKHEFGEDERARYAEALETLGQEAQGGHKAKDKDKKTKGGRPKHDA